MTRSLGHHSPLSLSLSLVPLWISAVGPKATINDFVGSWTVTPPPPPSKTKCWNGLNTEENCKSSVNSHSRAWKKHQSTIGHTRLHVWANLDACIQSLSLPTKWPSTSSWEAMISQAAMHKCNPEWFWNHWHLNDRSAYFKSHQHAQVMIIGHHWASLGIIGHHCVMFQDCPEFALFPASMVIADNTRNRLSWSLGWVSSHCLRSSKALRLRQVASTCLYVSHIVLIIERSGILAMSCSKHQSCCSKCSAINTSALAASAARKAFASGSNAASRRLGGFQALMTGWWLWPPGERSSLYQRLKTLGGFLKWGYPKMDGL